ncbi:MAG: hypothetical protein N4A45_12700 [Flavobacteriales bacterium]|jgi:hypothetical protein|nr:hypothetical protein [Flavobacteriales bacterium]
MKKVLIGLLFSLFIIKSQAQETAVKVATRKGMLVEFSLGYGNIRFFDSKKTTGFDKSQGSFTFPDLKLGYFLNENTALTLSKLGVIYDENGRDRHFGALLPGVQYWLMDSWWIHAGIGMSIDGSALYDIKKGDEWHYGCAVSLSTGREFFKTKNFALSMQSRILLGRAFLPNEAHLDAITFGFGFGFSWF